MGRSVVRWILWLLGSLPAGSALGIEEHRPTGDRLHWVLVTTDTHIGTAGDRARENLAWVVRDAYVVVKPEWIVVTGDLTDASPGGLLPWGPQESEWRDYRDLLLASGMNASVYLDLPGNHDQYNDRGMTHYLRWSIQGAATGRTQQSLRMGDAGGGVHLLGLSTPGNDGAIAPLDHAGLDPGELLFAQQAMESHADAAIHVVFGHHPLENLESGRRELEDLLRTWDVAAYVYGHTHQYRASFRGRTLFLNLDSLGKADRNHLALLALDGTILAVRAFDAGKWPMILITTPADTMLGGGNPRAPSLPPDWPECPIRALVFGDRPPEQVTAQVDDRPPIPLQPAGQGLFEGSLDTTGLASGAHRLRVRAAPWNRGDHEITFRVGATACRNGRDDDFDGLTDWPDDPGCPSPLSEREDRIPPDPADPGEDPDGPGPGGALPDSGEDLPAPESGTGAEESMSGETAVEERVEEPDRWSSEIGAGPRDSGCDAEVPEVGGVGDAEAPEVVGADGEGPVVPGRKSGACSATPEPSPCGEWLPLLGLALASGLRRSRREARHPRHRRSVG